MRNKLQVFILLISMAWIASSCLDDNEYEYEYPNDTAITAFSLGTVDRYVHTLSSKDEDSVYTEDVDGSEYKFYIDQVKKIIYNPDSLPKGCDATRILATISSKNSGVIGIKDTKSDSIAAYSSSDSIDFSVPREIRAYNVIGTAYSAYTHRECTQGRPRLLWLAYLGAKQRGVGGISPGKSRERERADIFVWHRRHKQLAYLCHRHHGRSGMGRNNARRFPLP